MALKQMHKICQKLIAQYSLYGIAIVHRTGLVPVSDASVAIVTVSAHRRAAIDACSDAIDILKETVPIWKKEFYEDGSKWKQNPEF
jgi:molybdopterin synthase catalytic subunit